MVSMKICNFSCLICSTKSCLLFFQGPGGRSLIEIQQISGANIQISKKGIFAPGTRNRIVTISGNPHAITTAQYLIEQRIGEEELKRARNNVGTLAMQ